jgi:hypothetical protein
MSTLPWKDKYTVVSSLVGVCLEERTTSSIADTATSAALAQSPPPPRTTAGMVVMNKVSREAKTAKGRTK